MLSVCLYVDDMIYTSNLMLEEFRTVTKNEFEMTDEVLGLEVTQPDQGIFIYQHKYATDILQRFRMNKCKPAETPIALGIELTKLMYLTATRPDQMYDVSLISRFMETPKDSHWKVGKRIRRYVASTLGYDLWYTHTLDSTLIG